MLDLLGPCNNHVFQIICHLILGIEHLTISMKQYCEILSFIFVPFFVPRILVMIAMVVLKSTMTIIVTMSMISMIVISIVTSLSDKRWIYWGWPEAKGRRGPELKLRRYPEVFQRPSAVETVLHSKRKPVRRSYKRRVVENFRDCSQFLSDPGVPGPIFVSGCPSVRHSERLCRLNWCDSGWWGYQLNTNW